MAPVADPDARGTSSRGRRALIATLVVVAVVVPSTSRAALSAAELASVPGIGARAGFSPGGAIFNETDAELARSLDAR